MSRLGITSKNYVLVTLHRPVNVDDERQLDRLLAALDEISNKIPVVFPAHPRTTKNLARFHPEMKTDSGSVRKKPGSDLTIISPQGYLDFLNLEMNAVFVITDSGGMQAETTVLGVPCLTLNESPVWRVTIEQGTNILVGTDSQQLIKYATKIMETRKGSKKESSSSYHKSPKLPDLWDGKAGERIVKIIAGVKS